MLAILLAVFFGAIAIGLMEEKDMTSKVVGFALLMCIGTWPFSILILSAMLGGR
jgi:hypothetical protein